MPEEKKDFVVKDRRFFSEENRDSKEDNEESPKEEAKTRLSENKKEPLKNDAGAETQLPEINFATFIFSLHSSVLLQLGLIEDPATGRKSKKPAGCKTDHRYIRYAGREDPRESDKGGRGDVEEHTL